MDQKKRILKVNFSSIGAGLGDSLGGEKRFVKEFIVDRIALLGGGGKRDLR